MRGIFNTCLTSQDLIMEAGEIAVGMQVRYPRTGTRGTVIRLDSLTEGLFAELDSTHLLYRVDQLIPAEGASKKTSSKTEDIKKKILEDREFASGSGLQEALKGIDQSCEGGG